MATATPTRCGATIARFTRRRIASTTIDSLPSSSRFLSNTTTALQEDRSGSESSTNNSSRLHPRWAYTPAAMVAPVRHRPQNLQNVFNVNNSPKKLDSVIDGILGPGFESSKVLDDEVKWLVVTHKSFDHGRRGFNDRLAFLGTRIVELQTSLAILSSPKARSKSEDLEDPFDRTPFKHPALEGLEGLTEHIRSGVLSKRRLHQLAHSYGLTKVLRWKPRKPSDLIESGIEGVSSQALMALIGAISLQQGGEIANRVVRERILRPLGLL